MADKVLVNQHGKLYLGELRDGKLDPAYEVRYEVFPGPQGIATMMIVTPVWMLSSLRVLPVVDGAIVVPVSELSSGDRDKLIRGIAGADEMIRQAKAQDSGIALVSR